MTYLQMWSELKGMVPNFPVPLAKTCINRAWRDVRRQNLWSFQLYEGNWITPAVISAGAVTVTRGSTAVTVDATAQAAINAISSISTIVQRQFRTSVGRTIYNIAGWSSGTLTLALDRAYGETSAANTGYQILQVYYAAPYQDHLTFFSIRNQEFFRILKHNTPRHELDRRDPMRTWSNFPSHVAMYQTDNNSTSPTYRYPLYEIWGIPLSVMTFQLYGVRKLTDLTLPSDSLPPQIGEDCIVELAKVYAYQWAEAHKADLAKGGPDWKFLMGSAMSEHKRLLKDYRRQDRETVNNFFSIRQLPSDRAHAYYNGLVGVAYPGIPS